MIDVKTGFNMLRALKGQKDPVTLEVKITNSSDVKELVTLNCKLPTNLGFDKTGIIRDQRRRIGYVEPGETKVEIFEIYIKSTVNEGVEKIDVKVIVHPEDRYDKEKQSINRTAELRIISR